MTPCLLPEGPAFVQSLTPEEHQRRYGCPIIVWSQFGYRWQPATEGTAAGWVRPHGVKEVQAKPDFTKYGQPINSPDLHDLWDVWKGR